MPEGKLCSHFQEVAVMGFNCDPQTVCFQSHSFYSYLLTLVVQDLHPGVPIMVPLLQAGFTDIRLDKMAWITGCQAILIALC